MANVNQFRVLLELENERLENQCEEWRNTLKNNIISDEFTGQIFSAIGLTDLLLNYKLKQFRTLIENSEKGGFGNITLTDLQGFWDLVKIQIDDVDKKFHDLKVLKQNQWKEDKLDCDTAPKKSLLTPLAVHNGKRIEKYRIKNTRSAGSLRRIKAKVNLQHPSEN